MATVYINSKKQKYYLHKGKTKTGKDKFYLSQKSEGAVDESIPKGYEVYENPNGQFYIRKIQKQIITDQEKQIVEEGLKKYSTLKSFKVYIKKNMIEIYTPNQDIDVLEEITNRFSPVKVVDRDFLSTIIEYSSNMRFVLIDKEKRLFNVQRYNYRGSIDDWINIDFFQPLEELVEEYVRHLGEDSFFELYWGGKDFI